MFRIHYKGYFYVVRPSGIYYEVTIMDRSYKAVIQEDVKKAYTEACNYCREFIDNLVK